MAIRVTQFVNEVWVTNPSRIRVTQFGNEVWMRPVPGRIRVTQYGIEVWRTVAGAPLTITGNADGYATAWTITSLGMTTGGNADGYATARDATGPPFAPIMVVMGI